MSADGGRLVGVAEISTVIAGSESPDVVGTEIGSVAGLATLEIAGASAAGMTFGSDDAGDGAVLMGNTLSVTGETGTVAAAPAASAPAASVPTASAPGLVINFVYDASVADAPVQFKQALTVVADDLGKLILNPITVNIEVGWGEDAGDSIAEALATGGPLDGTTVSYTKFKRDFIANESSTTDAIAAAYLPASDPTRGRGITLSPAQEKAWGLLPANGSELDGSVGFSTDADFDWTENAGTAGYDFVGVAEHEITHAMGRISGSDLDLFSYAAPGISQATGYFGAPYFSINGGTTDLGNFDTTSDPADWADGTGPDSFDAYSSLDVANPITSADDTLLGALGYRVAACFASGTRIRTPRGEVAVENLLPDDCVVSALSSAAVPVTWIGHRPIACRRHPAPERVQPVRVRRGAFGARMPARDLILSPDHAIFTHGVLIPVKYLIDGVTIIRLDVARVTYWHVELPRHDVLFAEGLPAESYLDTGNRACFIEGAAHVALHPDFASRTWDETCRPMAARRAGGGIGAARPDRPGSAARLVRQHGACRRCRDPASPMVAGLRHLYLLQDVRQIRIVGDRPRGVLLNGRPTDRLVMHLGRPRAILELLVGPSLAPRDAGLRARSTTTESSCGVERALSLCLGRHLCRRADALVCRRCLSGLRIDAG